jgi:hypothetical protein
MMHPQVADGNDLQTWRITTNRLNKQSQAADVGLSFGMVVDKQLSIKVSMFRSVTHGLGLGTFFCMT